MNRIAIFGIVRMHRAKAAIAAGFVVLMAGIVTNAVVLQNGHHPAPLFGLQPRPAGAELHAAGLAEPGEEPANMPAAPQGAAPEGAEPVVPPAPPVSPSPGVPALPTAHAPLAPNALSAPHALLAPHAADAALLPHHEDGIGQWLRRGNKPLAAPAQFGDDDAAPPPRASAARASRRLPAPEAKLDPITRLLRGHDEAGPGSIRPKAADPVLLKVQHALVKRGFTLHADGRMDDATRQAIDKFQRAHNRAPEREVTPKLLRDLGLAANLAPG